jgi:WD40 repeat protein
VRWDAETFSLLPSIPLVPDKTQGESKPVLSSAVISEDGERILLTLLPAGTEDARVWAWSDFDHDYHLSGASLNFKDTVRSASWSRDGNSLYIFPMQFDQAECRVFSFDGGRYQEKSNIAKVSAGAISPDDRWLATASKGGKVQIWDAQTLQEVPETPSLKTSLVPEEFNPETRILFLSFSRDGQQLGATARNESARLWDLHSGKSRALRPKSPQDQIVRIAFAAGRRGEQRVAMGMSGMVAILDTDKLDQLSEPICVPEVTVFPMFNSDGTRIITLSGPLRTTMNMLRVWDTSFRKPVTDAGGNHFDGKSPPQWLSELADAITGGRLTTDDDDLQPPTLSDLRTKYANSSYPDQYQIIWNRFLGRDQGPSKPVKEP